NLLGSSRQEDYFFAERKPKSSGGSRVDRKTGAGSWTLNKKQEAVRSMVGGREMVVGRKSYLSFNDGRRKNSGWSMYEYEMISSGFQRRVLCHVKNSNPAISGGGTTIETSDVSPPPTAVVQQPVSAPVVTPPECRPSSSRPSSVDSVAPNEAGVPPSATDVGGGELVITAEEFDAFLCWCERL
ncbi:unnamed protein product, partial [Musa textilis]